MPSNFFLTDADSDVSGYLLAKLTSPSDAPSLVRAVTTTVTGPTSGVQATRSAGGTALAWITEPLDGTDLTAAAWTLRLWAKESAAATNAALRFQVVKWAGSEGASVLDDNAGTELTTTIADVNITTGVASVTALAAGDRLVFKVLFDDASSSMAAGTATLSYGGQYPFAEGYSYVTCPDTKALSATTPTATVTRVRQALKDTSATNPNLETAEVTQAIEAAVRTYSHDRPRTIVSALSGDGSSVDYRLPARWVWGFSHVIDLEYPAGEQYRVLLDDDDWEVLDTALGGIPRRVLHFPSITLEAGTDNALVRYTGRHVHTDQLDTIPPDDLDAFTWLAASYGAEMLAAQSAASSRPTIEADSTDHQAGEERWSNVARRLRKLYDEHIGAGGENGLAGASAFVDWDTTMSTGMPWLGPPYGRRLR